MTVMIFPNDKAKELYPLIMFFSHIQCSLCNLKMILSELSLLKSECKLYSVFLLDNGRYSFALQKESTMGQWFSSQAEPVISGIKAKGSSCSEVFISSKQEKTVPFSLQFFRMLLHGCLHCYKQWNSQNCYDLHYNLPASFLQSQILE